MTPAYVAGQSTEFTFRGMPGVGWPFYIVSQVSIPFGNVPHLDMNASPLHRQIHLAGTFPNISQLHLRVPSGKLSHNYGTSQFSMDKSTNSLAIFNFSIVFSMFTRGSTGTCPISPDSPSLPMAQRQVQVRGGHESNGLGGVPVVRRRLFHRWLVNDTMINGFHIFWYLLG